MKKQLLGTILAAAIPLAAFPQGGPPPGAPAKGQAGATARGPGAWRGNPEAMEKRMRLARTLGLAEALDLEPAAALKLGDTVGKFDARRLAAHRTLHDAQLVLRRAAQGEKVPAGDVDQAIQKSLDARAQLQAIDRETVQAVTQGMSPEQKARAVLFLARFQQRFGPMGGMGPGMMRGGMGPGMMHRGMGPGMMGGGMGSGRGMGPGMMGGGMGPQAGFGPGSANCDGMGPGAMMGSGAGFDGGPEE